MRRRLALLLLGNEEGYAASFKKPLSEAAEALGYRLVLFGIAVNISCICSPQCFGLRSGLKVAPHGAPSGLVLVSLVIVK
jgi:hypothetical protein